MNIPTTEAGKEEWFRARLDEEPLQTNFLIQFLIDLKKQGAEEQADSWAELLQDTLIEQDKPEEVLNVLSVRAVWQSSSAVNSKRWAVVADRALEHFHEQRKFVAHAGFDKGISPTEAIRRLQLLMKLKPGVLCMDKTWGLGVVRKLDTFYARVDIDFDKKSEHQMSLAYAAETLQILDDSHILARIHNDRDGMKELATSDPAGVVKIAIESLGPLTVERIQETLIPRLIAQDEWKKFWDGARKVLKKDELVDIPSKRSLPIRLLEKAKAFDEDWFARLQKERDMRTVLILVNEVLTEKEVLAEEAWLRVVGDRLAFVVKGAGGNDPAMVAEAVMAAHAAGVDSEQVNVAAHAARFFDDKLFLAVVGKLPARLIRPFMNFLVQEDQERTSELLLRLLKRLDMTTLNEAIDYLLANGRQAEVSGILREVCTNQNAEVEVLYWISRNLDKLETWSLCPLPTLGRMILSDLNHDYTGDRLKTKNQLRARFEQKEFLSDLLAAMTPLRREETLEWVRNNTGWSTLDRQSLMGKMIKMYPELQQVLSTPSAADETAEKKRGLVTSERSYLERQRQLEKLIKVDIPQNSKEIAVARSYGDLSENHEYKAAKEMQGILLRRRAELEMMLQRVMPTKFEDFPSDKVGPGTGVLLDYGNGKVERYHILGEWDKDEALGIISCETKMAKALEDHVAGDEVTVPSEEGETTCRIVEVTALPKDVEEWLTADSVG